MKEEISEKIKKRREYYRKYYLKNKEKEHLRKKKYRENMTKEMKEKRIEYMKIYNKEYDKKFGKERYKKRKEYRENYIRKYYLKNKEKIQEYKKSFKGKVIEMYKYMCSRTKKYQYKEKVINKNLFLEFAFNSLQYKKIYNKWVKSNYENKLKPTIDRIDNTKGYAEGNLQFLTLSKNCKKGNKETIGNKKKIKFIKNNKEKIFNSVNEAAKFLKRDRGIISDLIKKDKLSYNGWKISYVV